MTEQDHVDRIGALEAHLLARPDNLRAVPAGQAMAWVAAAIELAEGSLLVRVDGWGFIVVVWLLDGRLVLLCHHVYLISTLSYDDGQQELGRPVRRSEASLWEPPGKGGEPLIKVCLK